MIIAVDFDGTVVEHNFPRIGPPVPYALDYLRQFLALKARLILWTMRSDGQERGDVLTQAVNYLSQHEITLWGINENPGQKHWTSSPKVYAHQYIDDANAHCPVIPGTLSRPMVDWSKVGPHILKQLSGEE